MLCQTSCQLFLCLIKFEDIEIQVQSQRTDYSRPGHIPNSKQSGVLERKYRINSVMVARREQMRDDHQCCLWNPQRQDDHQSIREQDSNQPTLQLVTTEEDWPIEVSSKLKGHEYSNHLRPLIAEGVYSEYREGFNIGTEVSILRTFNTCK